MKIGILQTGHAPETLIDQTGDYGEIFQHLLDDFGFEFEVWSVVDGIFPADLHAADGWLITGSRHGAYEDHPWIPRLEDLVREIYTDGRPMVGVCFGHQIIAQALGGKVEKFDGGWSVGRVEYEIDGETVAVNAWHQDQVVKRPAEARVIGSTPFCENAVLVYGDKALTIQPHPEFTPEFMKGLIETRGKGVVPDPLLDAARDTLMLPVDQAKVAAQMAAFFKKDRSHV